MADQREEGRPGPEWCEDKLCSGYGGRHAGKHVFFLPADNRKGLSNRSVATTGAVESMSGGLTVEAEARELEESLRKWGCSCSTLHPAQHDPQQYRDCAITALRWQIKEMLGPLWLERHDAALREKVTREVGALWMETQRDELDTNLRIAERIGIIKAIKEGKSYEDAEVELFDALRQAGEQLAEALEQMRVSVSVDDPCFCQWADSGHSSECRGARAALSSWRALRGEQK